MYGDISNNVHMSKNVTKPVVILFVLEIYILCCFYFDYQSFAIMKDLTCFVTAPAIDG